MLLSLLPSSSSPSITTSWLVPTSSSILPNASYVDHKPHSLTYSAKRPPTPAPKRKARASEPIPRSTKAPAKKKARYSYDMIRRSDEDGDDDESQDDEDGKDDESVPDEGDSVGSAAQ